MRNKRLYAAAAEGARHSEQVYSLQYTGLSTTVAAKKHIGLLQVRQPDLTQVPDMIYLQLRECHTN